MRRQFKMAFGGWLAATAAGLGQSPQPQTAPAQPARYVTPFGVAAQLPDPNSPTRPGLAAGSYVPVQPLQAGTIVAMQQQAGVQYIPVQAVGNGQYVPLQPVQSGPITQAPSGPPTPVTAAATTVSSQAAAAPQSVAAVPAQTTSTSAAASPTVQYIPVQPISTTGANGQTTIQYVPIQPTSGNPGGAPATAQFVPAPQPNSNVPAQARPVAPPPANGSSCSTGQCGQPTCDICQPSCQTCGPAGQMWLSTEYLLWWTRGMNVPALVTTSPPGTPRSQAGVLGAPNTRVLFGDEDLNDEVRSGFRLRAGYWLDCCHSCGIEGSYFFLGKANDDFAVGSNGNQIIARPFTNINGQNDSQLVSFPHEDSQLVNFPNLLAGSVVVNSSSGFSGFDLNLRKKLRCDCCNRIDWLFGFRYLKLNDDLTINEDLTVTGSDPLQATIPVGTRFQVYDSFRTRDEFYGPQLGFAGEHRRGQYFVNWRAALAMGTTHKEVTIDGSTTITLPGGAPSTYPGGLSALPTNMGNYSKNDFAVVPELGINVGYQFSECFRVFVGYSFIYWSNVTRVGDTIDTVVNPTQLPPGQLSGQPRPAFTWNDSDFWAQGVSFGAEVRY